MNARIRHFILDMLIFGSAALFIVAVAALLSGCATDCDYKQGFTCWHVR